MSTLVDHLETFLGPIECGWDTSPDGERMPFQIVRCTGNAMPGVTSYATLGLSNAALEVADGSKAIRHELLWMARDDSGLQIPSKLHQLGMEALARSTPYLRGEVIGPRGPLFPRGQLEALYCAAPVYFPDGFASCRRDDGQAVVIAWLVPITAVEARYVQTHGWSAFEDLLVEHDPDLLDVERESVACCRDGKA